MKYLLQREKIDCIICQGKRFRLKYIKRSRNRQPFAIVKCRTCGLFFVNRRPKKEFLKEYYSMEYFNFRDDRGYDNYLSDKIEHEFKRVLHLNLKDLGFYEWEKNLLSQANRPKPRMLDIGAASGIAVHWFNQRGWEAMGIEVAEELARAGQEKFKIEIKTGDFLDLDLPAKKFDLITMFATIEHLAEPHLFMKKISRIIKEGGRLILTTCRADTIGFRIFFGRKWRFFNVPEHLFYFSSRLIVRMAGNCGFRKIKLITYGSGLSGRKKKWGDFLARIFGLGDMMALILEKTQA